MDFSNTIRSKLLPALAAFALFFVVSAAYFAPQFRGEALPQHDVIQYEGMAKDIATCAPRRAKTRSGRAACSAACRPT